MKIRVLCAVLFVALLSPCASRAQISAFTYQGRLNDNGSSANGTYDLQFTAYDAASNGNAMSTTQTNLAVAVTNGFFTVSIDFGANVFDGSVRWLQIGARTNGNTGAFTLLNPRQLITSAPYALRAANANAAASATSVSGSVSASQLTGTISSNNIADGTITAAKLASGSVTSNALASGAVTTTAIADGAVNASKLLSATNWFARSLLRPDAQGADNFGTAMAAMPPDKVLVGSYSANVHLYHTNGTLLRTITNGSGGFGSALATVGTDKALIGQPYASLGNGSRGAAYLYKSDGTLLTSFTNPTPNLSDTFGAALAAVASDRVMIADPGADVGTNGSGVAYLFGTNGGLITVFTNPIPQTFASFGCALAAVGSDKVVIGASGHDAGTVIYAGAAYLFNTNGTLLQTFTNPAPENYDQWGKSVAAVGTNMLLIGAIGDDPGNGGSVYLFNTNGNLVMTFTNPSPSSSDDFGYSIASVGQDKVLIGAPGDTFAGGMTYLFSTNGVLLNVFTNPTPETGDLFGNAVAAITTNTLVIGAPGDNLAGSAAGMAYLFSPQRYASGIVTEAVPPGSITRFQLAQGAVTPEKLSGVLYLEQIPVLDSSRIPDLNADKITSGTINDARLSNNVARLNRNQTFSGVNSFTNSGNSFTGNGGGLTSLNSTNLTGTISDARLSLNVPLLNRNQTFSGTNTFLDSLCIGNFQGGTAVSDVASYNKELILSGDLNTGFNTGSAVKLLINGYDNESGADIYPIYVEDENNVVDFYIRNQGGLRSAYFAGTVTAPSFGGTPDFTGQITASGGIRMQNTNIWLRGGSDVNHGLGWYGSGKPFANASPDGPVLFGYNAGALGTLNGSQKIALWWNSSEQVGIGMTNPSAQLHVSSTGGNSNPQTWLNQETSSDYSRLRMTVSSNYTHRWDMAANSNTFTIYSGYHNASMLVLDNNGLTVRGTVVSSSDRNIKDKVLPVNPQQVLEKVASLPISEWNYKDAPETRHVGPMAQDFYSAFGLGTDDKHIATVDADGVALAAIQGLKQRVDTQLEQKDAAIEKLQRENQTLQRRLERLERLLLEMNPRTE